MNPHEIAEAARFGGFRGDDLRNAVAVALSESGGDPNYRDRNRWGLFALPLDAIQRADINHRDPMQNAMVAHSIYMETGGFHPWPSFRNGTYRQWLLHAAQVTQEATARVIYDADGIDRKWIGFRPADMLKESRRY